MATRDKEERAAENWPSRLSAMDSVARMLTSVVNWIESMLAGALAGGLAKTVIAPGDRVKIIFQADSNRPFSLRAAVKVGAKIVEGSGVLGLWRGHGATLLRIMPYAATSYTSFDYYKAAIAASLGVREDSSDDGRAVVARFFAGSAAGATATALVYPLDLFRARFAAHWDTAKRYPSYPAAVRAVVREEGPLALYAGLTPTLVGIVPYSGTTYCVYETLTATVAKSIGVDSPKQLPPSHSFICGSIAGLIGQSATYPLDIVRRRMQVHPQRYTTMLQAARLVYMEEGVVGGLFKGLSMNWIKGPISVGISFTTRDYFKRRIHEYHTQQASVVEASPPEHVPPGKWAGQLSFPERFVCGGVAALLAKLWTLPFDRVRIMYAIGQQTTDEHSSVSRHIARTMVDLFQDSPHMWQGSGAMMARVVPYAAICYASFTAFQGTAQRVTYASKASQEPASNFLAGAAAATTATIAVYPMDLIHARRAAAADPSRLSYVDELRQLRRGGVRQLFKGLVPTVVGIAPTAGISFSLYHEGVRRAQTDNFLAHFAIGTGAGAVAQAVTYPLNVVRRRVQVEAVDAGVVQHVAKIYRHDGLFTGLYRRMPLGWVLSPTTIGLSFAVYDALAKSMETVRHLNRGVHIDLAAAGLGVGNSIAGPSE